jgi:hypothetical protein
MISGKWKGAGAAVLAAALAGCQAMGPPPMRSPVATQPPPSQMAGIDGQWMSTDGEAVSRFVNGRFETIATDTGNRLSEGSYQQSGDNIYQISGTSLIRQTPISFNCMLITPTQLNCTGAAGNQFSLVRSQGFS